MTVLSDEQLREICTDSLDDDVPFTYARAVERAVVAALTARGGVDVEAAVEAIHQCMDGSHDAFGTRDCSECGAGIADALRLAIAQQAAQYEAREARWRELDAIYQRATVAMLGSEVVRVAELRRELGVE